jgi:hypothetical protein
MNKVDFQYYVDRINRYGLSAEYKLGQTVGSLYIFLTNPHDDDTMFDYAQKIKSPFLFNVVLIRTIEKVVEQGNIDKATAYAKLYRMDGLAELRQQRYLFGIRHYAGFNFENVLIQCVYLEKINSGTNADEDFQIRFNPKSAVPRLSLHDLPRPLTVDNMIKKCAIRLVSENGKYRYIDDKGAIVQAASDDQLWNKKIGKMYGSDETDE